MKKISYKNKITATLLAVTLLPVLVISCMYIYNSYQKTRESAVADFEAKFLSGMLRLNYSMIKIDQNMRFVSNYSFLYKILTQSKPVDLLDSIENSKLLEDIFSALLSDGSVSEITIYTSNENVLNSKHVKRLQYLKGKPYFNPEILEKPSFWQYYSGEMKTQNDEYLLLYREYKTLNDNINVIEVKILMQSVRQYFEFDSDDALCFFSVNSSKAVQLSGIPYPYSELNRHEYHTLTREIPALNSVCSLYISKAFMSSSMKFPIMVSLIIALAMMAGVTLLVNYIAKALTQRLSDICARIAKGDTSPNGDEFDIISDKFDELLMNMKLENERELRLKKENMNLEVRLLQEKISPHFLYNTLSAIKWVYKNEELGGIIDSMVNYYRAVLNKGNDYIELAKEKECLTQYMKIQRFSYGTDFDCEIIIPPALENTLILKHILQPVVENAFLHGVNSRSGGGGQITVEAKACPDAVLLTVHDNGPGISPEVIERILSGEQGISLKGGSGYALQNIQRRIRLCYGGDYGISISAAGGTTVEIRLPYHGHNTGPQGGKAIQ